MALQQCGLNLNRERNELRPHGTLDFPCAGYSTLYTDQPEDFIPWHWHEELELLYVASGRLELRLPAKTFYVEQGDAFAVNSNVLHYGRAVGSCQLHSLVFRPVLVWGSEDAVFAKKYLRPLTGCSAFSGVPLLERDQPEAVDWFCQAFDAMVEEPFGFEFSVREQLSRICLLLTRQFQRQLEAPGIARSQDDLRIHKMLAYMHKNFANDLTVSEIGASAGIGERECLRCFQKTIQLSPIQYLLKYRVMQGAALLRGHPEYSIAGVATLCGFDSPSNFTKIFRRFYSCTPREYRKSKTESID